MPNSHYATIEFLSGIIRVYDEKRDDSIHNTGIPFLFSLTVRWITTEEVEILGLSTDKLTLSSWRAIGIALNKYGVKKVRYIRYKNGQKIEKSVSFSEKWLTR
jgi:hypothetical protein